MRQNRSISVEVWAASFLLLSGVLCQVAFAPPKVIGITPSFGGGLAFVDVFLTDDAGGTPPTIGGFGQTLTFDPTILTALDVTFAPFLGDPNDPSETNTMVSLGADRIIFDETSFLSFSELDALQTGDVLLATITFEPIAVGTSPISFAQSLINDPLGAPIDHSTEGTSITVPEPSVAAWVATLGCIVLLVRWRQGC